MKKRNGYTLIELLIVIALLGALAIGLLATIDPFEQLKKGHDMSVLNTANEIYSAVIRFSGVDNKSPYAEDVNGIRLDSDQGKSIILQLVNKGELKSNFTNLYGNVASELYFTGRSDLSFFTICFKPESKSFKLNYPVKYDQYGAITNCSTHGCFLCLDENGNPSLVESQIGATVTPSPTSAQVNSCDNFDPNRPLYPFTCMYSSKWSTYGCTNYCVTDFGCDSYCPAGERHLQKNYFAWSGANMENCLAHTLATTEDYCVSGTPANCSNIPYRSSSSDFVWGCSNPQRPYQWK